MVETLTELQEPDPRTLHFLPTGLGVGVRMAPEAAARHHLQVAESVALAPGVGQGTRQTFDRLRSAYAYGVLEYDLFTVVRDSAVLVLEQALRDRFLEWHHGTVTFVDREGQDRPIQADCWEQVHEVTNSQKWRLRVDDGGKPMSFNGMLAVLLSWARRVGLLRGQRNRIAEQSLATLRHSVAHPTSYQLITPVDAARTLGSLAEIINQLWGHTTPGGSLYPAPIRREVVAVGWRGAAGRTLSTLAQNLSAATDLNDGWQFILIRAIYDVAGVGREPDLFMFDSEFETTRYPSELLWGPGTRAEAVAWLNVTSPQHDECDHLDRTFFIREHAGWLDLPRQRVAVVGLPTAEREGTWHVVRADHPGDAYAHVRNVAGAGQGCRPTGPCARCPAETLRVGDYDTVVARRAPASPVSQRPAVRTPWALPGSHMLA